MNWLNRFADPVYCLVRLIVGLMFACHGGQSLSAQEYKDFGKERLNSSPRHGEWVDIKSGDRTIKAFVVYPERKDKAPAVLVIQEIFGLTDWLRSMCDELAENGVIAIAPDFLNGQKFEDADGASKAKTAVTEDQVEGDSHGFMRQGEPTNPNMREGDKKARDEAWARWKTLLKQLP